MGRLTSVIVGVGLIAVSMSVASVLAEVNEAPEPGGASPGFVVVLADGTVIPAKAKPVCAFGSFRYVEPTGRTKVLRVSAVDLEATREFNAQVPDDPSAGTFSVGGGVTIQGSDPVTTLDDQSEAEPSRLKSVTVYSATWCGYCNQLKSFLAANGISATVVEVDRLPDDQQQTARSEMKRLTGRVAFPTVIIGGEAQAGFSPSWIKSKLAS
ncbi:MAG: glutaredoxin family protein [Thermoanaerobaculales bacterium]|jgi:glutaredoxin|nr:glutaredoxin family protein [Thermoanaerobaculales bacterium]MCU0305791.1 glutaredoxin family protein [Thermoanaerobaculales bacterium]